MLASTFTEGAQLLASLPMNNDPGDGTGGGGWSADAAVTSIRGFLFSLAVLGILAAVVVGMFTKGTRGDNKGAAKTTSSVLILCIPLGVVALGAVIGISTGLVNLGGVS